jgi:hypothetical protein
MIENVPVVLMPKVRSKALTDSAYGMPCAFRLPGVCNHDRATTVWCHLPGIGKSMRSKVSDLHGAYGCSRCHDVIDGRAGDTHGLTPTILLDAMLRAICETQSRLAAIGIIKVKGGTLI